MAIEYRCPCGRTFTPEYESQADEFFSGDNYISRWNEACPHCGRELLVTETYKLNEVEIDAEGDE